MTAVLRLPIPGGGLVDYRLTGTAAPRPTGGPLSRVAFAAAHVVVDPLAAGDPVTEPVVDWDATLAYRRYLWSMGLGVAEAMDTAQRGGALPWPLAAELIRRSAAEATAVPGARVGAGAGTDHLGPGEWTLEAITEAYLEQCAVVEDAGAQVILMASRALASRAGGPDDYARVYGDVLDAARRPAIIHWLGPMFDPALAGYWGSRDVAAATDACLAIIADHRERVDGIKVSLLDERHEVDMRRRLPAGVRLYTGDDYNFPDLIRGDDQGHSDALLGIFDGIAPVAATALEALAEGDGARYEALLAPTIPLSRHVFAPPVAHYKTGIVLLAFLNGHQGHFRMLGGMESARSIVHLARVFTLADAAGVLQDPDLAVHRMRILLEAAGVSQDGRAR